jgi:outer membrane protein TolC
MNTSFQRAIQAACVATVATACASSRIDTAEELARAEWRRGASAPAAQPAPAQPAPVEPAAWTLDEILVRIAAANPTLGRAQANLEQAQAARREARASWLPELSLGVDLLSTDDPALAFGLLLNQHALDLGPGFDATPGSTENWHEEVRLDWALLAPGRSDATSAATEGEQAAALARESAERRLLNAGIQAWIGLRAARELEAVARESVGVVEQRLLQTRTRHDEGAALRTDVLRLEVSLAAARQDAARAAQVVREAESQLNVLMGREAGGPLELVAEPVVLAAGLPEDLDALVQRASEERADVKAAAHRARMLSFEREAARAQYLPRLQAFARYGWDNEDLAIDSEYGSYAAGLSLRLPFSAATGPRIAQAEAQERGAREALRELSLSVTREVRDAWNAQRVARETLELARASVGSAEEAWRSISAAQDAGAATVTDVLEAENARRQARTRHVAAQAAVDLARARIAAAVGGVR